MTYEPYLSAVREKPDAGKIIATTLDYPMVMDTFGCTPAFLAANDTAAAALTKSYFEAIEMIGKEKDKALWHHGSRCEAVGRGSSAKSAAFLKWADAAGQPQGFLRRRVADLLGQGGRPAAGNRPDQDEARSEASLVETKYVAGAK